MKHKVFFQIGQKNSHEAKNVYKPVQNEAKWVLQFFFYETQNFFLKRPKNSHEARNIYKPVHNEAKWVFHKIFMKHKVFFQKGQKTLMKQKIHINQFKMKQNGCFIKFL